MPTVAHFKSRGRGLRRGRREALFELQVVRIEFGGPSTRAFFPAFCPLWRQSRLQASLLGRCGERPLTKADVQPACQTFGRFRNDGCLLLTAAAGAKLISFPFGLTTPLRTACSIFLDGRAFHVSVRTVNAAVAAYRLQLNAAAGAIEEIYARIQGHLSQCLGAAFGACERRSGKDFQQTTFQE